MWEFETSDYKYSSRRAPVYAKRAMAATSHPMATEAALSVFRRGGNAIDAALAAAGALCVVDPASNGPGGDCFALVYTGGHLYGLNASGFSPALLTPSVFESVKHTSVPYEGWLPVTVPGAPAGWGELSRRFGSMSLEQCFAPALELAQEQVLTHDTAGLLNYMSKKLADMGGELFAQWAKVYNPNAVTYHAGDVLRLPDMGETLKSIAQSGGEDFYRGELARRIGDYSAATGGLLRSDDLGAYHAQWVEPVRLSYKGYDICEIPPNGQGMTALMALGMLRELEIKDHDDEESVHTQMEAMKLAFADAARYIADPAYMDVDTQALLSGDYLRKRAFSITPQARMPECGEPDKGGTVYFCTADGEGNMVSMIQSLYLSFGSGVLVPGTGVTLQCRGANFTLEAGHPNRVGPRKKPYHTIIPGFIMQGEKAVGPFGVMGGFMQPQGHVQCIMNMIDFHMDPQQALDAPRWCWNKDLNFSMESKWDPALIESLRQRGHDIRIEDSHLYGRGQIILALDNGSLVAGSEPRADGMAAGY